MGGVAAQRPPFCSERAGHAPTQPGPSIRARTLYRTNENASRRHHVQRPQCPPGIVGRRRQQFGRTGGVAVCGEPWPRAAGPTGNRRLQMARDKKGRPRWPPRRETSTFNFRLSSVPALAHAASGRSGVAAGSALFLFLGQFAEQQVARTSLRATNL